MDSRSGRHPTALGEPRLDSRVATHVEKSLKQSSAVFCGGPQEGREVTLGEQHDLGELVQTHPERLPESVADVVSARRNGRPPAVRRPFLEPDLAADRRETRASLLGPLVIRRSDDPQPPPAHGELKLDLGHVVRRRVVAAQRLTRGPQTGHPPIQREADRVEQAGLAAARGTVDEEDAGVGKIVKVDVDTVRERPERLD